MRHVIRLRFDDAEQAAVDEIGGRLRAQGWADHVTVPRLLRNWQRLSARVERYRLTIDEYTNDLTTRDGLEIVLAECAEALRAKLRLAVEAADKEFLARTQDDVERVLERFIRIDEPSGWWWRRIPAAGRLAEELAEISLARRR